MKNISELTDFYYKTLYPVLESLEQNRKTLRHRIVVVGVLFTLFFIILGYSLLDAHIIQPDFIIGLIIGYIALGGALYKWLISDYAKDFKQKVIKPLITEIDKNLRYSPELHVPSEYFTRSRIFTSTPDRVSGNDFVRGKIDGVELQFSDFHAEKRHQDSKGRTSWSTIFQGLFIISEFPKHFKGNTIILPDAAESLFGSYLGSWLQSNNFGRNDLVKMDNIEFEKEFVVYGTDQIEARYILTHSLMEKLLTFKKRSKHPLSVSFRGGNIFMAIEYNKDLFEPSIFHSLLKYKIAMEYIKTLHLAIGIVEELKLNQKLWSKL